MTSVKSFVRDLAVGAAAGAVGTAAMDLLLYRRYRRESGSEGAWRWESAEDVTAWEGASAPGRLGEKVERAVIGHEPPERWARPTTNLVHWATGVGWGVQYAAVASLAPKHPLARALALGPLAWVSGYVVLPLARVYEPIWKYDARTLAKDLGAHLVYGTATSATFAALARPNSA
jgi:hypothetical protein